MNTWCMGSCGRLYFMSELRATDAGPMCKECYEQSRD